jgi:Ca-activated chloride channel family protein
MKSRRFPLLALLALPILLGDRASARDKVGLEVALANPVMSAAAPAKGGAPAKAKTYLKVALSGFAMEGDGAKRAPVNVAIVLDKSSSMAGEKMHHAREAAKEALRRCGPDDIVSVILYDSTVRVLVPATKLSDPAEVMARIDSVEAQGSTALFGGVTKGVDELRKFFDRNRVNRVILLSDGQANIGPSSPAALAELGASLRKDGISVSTIGIGEGYNEDLMFRLAERSDGNHAFAREPAELAAIFQKEFGDLLSVAAQEVLVRIRCRSGARPVRVLGREAEISGDEAIVVLNQLYANQQEYVLLEVEVPAGPDGATNVVADVEITYANLRTHRTDTLAAAVKARFSSSEREIAASVSPEVMAACAIQVATVNNGAALELRDEGKVEEARKLLLANQLFCEQQGSLWGDQKLVEYGGENESQAANLDPENWGRQRKIMRGQQLENYRIRETVYPGRQQSQQQSAAPPQQAPENSPGQ